MMEKLFESKIRKKNHHRGGINKKLMRVLKIATNLSSKVKVLVKEKLS